MGSRQNGSRDAICTPRASSVVANVLHKEAILVQSAAMGAARTANPEDATWTAQLRAAMLALSGTLAALYASI